MKINIIKKFTAIVFSISLLLYCEQNTQEWIFKIEGRKVYLSDFEAAYEAFLGIQAQSLQLTLKEIKNFIKDPESAPDPNTRNIFENLTKENFFDNYKATLLVNLEAEKEGFTKKSKNNKKLHFANKYFLANFYMEENVPEENFEIERSEVIETWENIRSKNPQYQRVPLSQGIKLTERSLRQQKKQKVINEQLTYLIEKYKIEENKPLVKQVKEEDSEEENQELSQEAPETQEEE